MEYLTVLSNVDGVRVVGFIPHLKARVFSLLSINVPIVVIQSVKR